MSTLIMGWGPLPFWPPRSLSSCVQTGTSSLTSGMGPCPFALAELSFVSFDLGVSAWGQSLNFTSLDKYQGSGQRPAVSCLRIRPFMFRMLQTPLSDTHPSLPSLSSLLTFACLRALDKLGPEIPSLLCGTEASSLKLKAGAAQGNLKAMKLLCLHSNISESVLLSLYSESWSLAGVVGWLKHRLLDPIV